MSNKPVPERWGEVIDSADHDMRSLAEELYAAEAKVRELEQDYRSQTTLVGRLGDEVEQLESKVRELEQAVERYSSLQKGRF